MADIREWTVTGMDCASCVAKLKGALGQMPGVDRIEVSLMAERLRLALDETRTPVGKIETTVRRLGYGIVAASVGLDAHLPTDVDDCACHGHDHGHHDHHGHDHNHDHHDHAHAHTHDHTHDHAHHHGSVASAASSVSVAPAPARKRTWYRTGKGKLVLFSGLVLAVAWAADLVLPTQWGQGAFVLACLVGLVPVARRAWAAASLGQYFSIEALMTIAATGAILIGAAQEAALVVFLFAVGELLEGVAVGQARDGIRALEKLVPQTALREENGAVKTVPANALRVNDVVLVRPGDRIPADGQILTGIGGIDESPVTGESVPVTRGPGESVFAGAINTESALRVQVTRAAQDNTIARIIRMVEQAEESRAPVERFITRFSRWYMPIIIALAVLVICVPPLALGQDWRTWIYRGLSLLLIGCPCALVISVPAAIASALSVGARYGILVKGGAVIEAAARVKVVSLDKTGTLTRGLPDVTDVVGLNGVTDRALLSVAAAVETASSHPLAQAIMRRAQDLALALPQVTQASVIPGKGVQAVVDGQRVIVASPRHAAQDGVMTPDILVRAEALEDQGKTVAVVYGDQVQGLIALRDEPREDAAQALRDLRALSVRPTILTGDNARTAAAIATLMGADFQAEMLPETKLEAIRVMGEQGGVMMVGDGINDAPALKQATVGVAVGSGTDVALETADAVLLRNRVADVPALIRLSRAAMGNIRQNVSIALGLKGLFLVTSVLGVTGLWMAIMADTGATVLVTLNALRLLRFRAHS